MTGSQPRERTRLFRVGLLPKTLGITILVVAPVTFALARTATRQLETKLERQFESKGEAIALSLAFAAERQGDSLSRAVNQVQDLIDAGSTIDGVAYIYIQDHEGSIAAHTFRPTFPPAFEETNWVEPGELQGMHRVKIAPAVTMEMADGRRITAIDIAAPISNGRVGLVHVGMDRDEIDRPVAALRGSMLFAAGLLGGGGSLFGAVLIALWIVQPVRTLHRVTSRVAETGDLSQTIVVRGSGEIADLMRSFERMLADLRRSRADLDEANRTLTIRVEERTREVEKQKAQLETANRDLAAREEIQQLYAEALRVFNESTDVEALVRDGLRAVCEFSGSLLGAVHIVDDSRTVLKTEAVLGVPASRIGAVFQMGEGLCGRAAETGEVVSVAHDPSWVVDTLCTGIAAHLIVAVPMTVRGKLVGVLEIATLAKELDPRRRMLLPTLGGQFAIAISNMRSSERTRFLAGSLEERNKKLLEQSDALQRQQTELDTKNKELERASRVKSEFLASMSHELRTPMNSIIGYTDLVLQRSGAALDGKMRRNMEKVLANAQHLLGLINGVLDLSKIESGKMELYLEEADPRTVLDQAATMSEVLLRDKPVKLIRDVSPELPRLRLDKTKFRQIALNLLANACKFTEKGEVRLKAELAPERKGWMRIVVEDTGIGIEEKDLPHVFEEFRQVGTVSKRDAGTGLGLAIVKKIVGMMGGEISVESTVGKGTRFTILLPASGVHAETAAPPAAATTPIPAMPVEVGRAADDRKARAEEHDAGEDAKKNLPMVLVVDDEPEAVMLVRETLSQLPYRVVGAFSGEEAVRIARKEKPFAILLDVMMPGFDGWSVIRVLKASPETEAIPVIFLSIIDNKPLGIRLGAADYLLKPVDRDALLGALARVAEGDVRRVLVVDDDPQVREILSEILAREGYEVETAEDADHAFQALERRLPQLMVLDLMMPRVNGFEVLRRLRAHPVWSEIPVLICTAKDLTAAERASLSRSVTRIIEKGSMENDVLLSEIAIALRSLEGARPKVAAQR